MAITIGGVRFPHNVFCATGARGFFGEGYWFHLYFKLLGLTWSGTNFAAKTTTLEVRKGNMPLAKDGISPADIIPRCIIPHLRTGHVLNAVGLSGPGAKDLLDRGLWQRIATPFVLSFMAVAETPEDRRKEYIGFVDLLEGYLSDFVSPFVLQLNFGCPNAGLPLEQLREESVDALQIMSKLPVPLVPNFNPLVPATLLKELEKTELCAGFWVANTIPYDYEGLGQSIFGREISPLSQRGFPSAGGISGPRCLAYLLCALSEARHIGVSLPIIGGNGIQTPRAVRLVEKAGASAIAIGTIAMVPPRMLLMRSVITTANHIMGN